MPVSIPPSVYWPYGQFSDSTTQNVASITAGQPITLNTDIIKNRMTHSTVSNTSRIQIDEAGKYLIIFSAIVNTTNATKQSIDIWMAVGGTNVANSNTRAYIPNQNTEITIAANFIYSFTAGQYFELYMCGDSTSVQVLSIAASTANPTRPDAPSIIVTVNKISE